MHTTFQTTRLNFFALLLLLLLLNGCGGQPTVVEEPVVEITPAEHAQQLFTNREYNAAAREFLVLADQSVPPASFEYRIAAAEAYIELDDSLKARNTLARLTPSALKTPLLLRHDMVLAQAAKIDQKPDQIIQALKQTPVAEALPEDKRHFLQLRIDAYDALEKSLEATHQRILIDPLLESYSTGDNRQKIWSALSAEEIETLEHLRSTAHDSDLTGWLELALIAKKNLHNHQTFNQQIQHWRYRYPAHPAEDPIILQLIETSEMLGKKISRIALLLPQEGRFAKAGAAVRDGFLSSWYKQNGQSDQPMVRVYNADATNILAMYQQAVSEGAELIVGPLEKEALKTLTTQVDLAVPVLALNQLSDIELSGAQHLIANNKLYQFGLSPEMEARQVARLAIAQGHTKALVISMEGAWGDRISRAFRSELEDLGGEVLEQQMYAAASKDYSTPVKQLLNIDGSEQRLNAIKKQLNRKVQFDTRRRQDADFIFMAALPVQARQIRPQLQFHKAGQMPVYATSHAYGLPSRDEPDLDMNGVIFGDMPWLLQYQKNETTTPLSMEQNWPENNASFLRLFALGIDAYHIIPHLGRLRIQEDAELSGQTGTLSINNDAQIERQLVWARFVGGLPEFMPPPPKQEEKPEIE